MSTRVARPGMWTFALVAAGQIVSVTGSGLTGFALGAWVYQRTQSTTQFALISLFTLLPSLVIAPVTGALVDRWDRRRVIILADIGGGLCTLAMALLFFAGRLQIWHIYVAMGLSSTCHGFRSPAYLASVSLLVPQEQLGRANGIMNLGDTSRYLLSPVLGGLLMGIIGVPGVMLIDTVTFLFAVATCLVVRFPRPTITAQAAPSSLLSESAVGWQYIYARPGLMGILIMYAVSSFATLMVDTLLVPLLLDLSSAEVAGSVMSAGGAGMLVGTLVAGAWGGPKRRMHGVFATLALVGLFVVLIGILQSVPLIAAATFGYFFPFPLMYACDGAIWQSKVSPEVQGRVFAMRRMIIMSMIPLAYVSAGPLADQVFKPLMIPTGPLAASLGPIIGVGPGRGGGLLISVMGLMVLLVTGVAMLNPHIRNVEDELPDAVRAQAIEVESSEEVKEIGALGTF
jgi:DHA3 family macrolide efflux protein-like MFS transporter